MGLLGGEVGSKKHTKNKKTHKNWTNKKLKEVEQLFVKQRARQKGVNKRINPYGDFAGKIF